MTETPARSHRQRNCRVLLVGDGQAMVRLENEFNGSALRVHDLFEAVGEITIATARQPIDAVVVERQSLIECGSDADEAARMLRRVDPSVRLVLLMRNGTEEAGAAEAFDASVEADANADVVRQALEREEIGEFQKSEVRSQKSELSNKDLTSDLRPQTCEPPAPVTSLGDTDLVEAVLAGKGSFAELALRLIAQQTKWTDVRIAPANEQPNLDAVAAPIRYEQDDHGLLMVSAGGADAPTLAELQPWSDWLARWLSLDKRQQQLRRQAMQDELTGAWNRRYFNAFLEEAMRRAVKRRRPITVMVFDIDDFKRYNDSYGHAAGDEILIEIVRLLSSVVRKGDRVCRIGGDEFAVLFADIEGPRMPGSAHPETVEQIAHRFQDEVCKMHFPKLGDDAPGSLTISAGLATYPWDGRDAQSLIEHADQLALQSKRKGKNVITLGPGAAEECRRTRT